MKPPQCVQGLRGHSQEKPAQGRGIGISGQPRQVLEHAIAGEEVGRFDPAESKDDRADQRQQGHANGVAVAALREPDLLLDELPEFELLEEDLEQEQPTKVGERLPSERTLEVARTASGHDSLAYLLGTLRCKQHFQEKRAFFNAPTHR